MALLVPAGLYCLNRAKSLAQPYWMIASVPLLFGIQQGIEGRLWQVIEAGDAEAVRMFALAFLFFSHFLWPLWIPLSSYLVEPDDRRKTAFLAVGILGALAGAVSYFPLLFFADWLSVDVLWHSIDYRITTAYGDYLSIDMDRAIYAVIVLIPLLESSHHHLRSFGLIVALSLLLAAVLYAHVFISVWCFFAAVLSLTIIRMFRGRQIANVVLE